MSNKIGLMDVIELAKQGYKPADIKELLEIELPEQTKDSGEQNPTTAPDTDSKSVPVSNEAESEDDNIDYKALYEESQKTVEKLQMANIQQNIDDPNRKTDEQTVLDWAKSFM